MMVKYCVVCLEQHCQQAMGDDPAPLLCPGKASSGTAVSSSELLSTKDMELLEQFMWRVAKMIRRSLYVK